MFVHRPTVHVFNVYCVHCKIWSEVSNSFLFQMDVNWGMSLDNFELIYKTEILCTDRWSWSVELQPRPVAKGGHFGAVPPRWSGVPPRWMFPAECLPLSAPPLNSPRWVPPGECPPAECRPPSAPLSPPTSPVEFVKLRNLADYPPPRIRKTSPTTPPLEFVGAPLLVTAPALLRLATGLLQPRFSLNFVTKKRSVLNWLEILCCVSFFLNDASQVWNCSWLTQTIISRRGVQFKGIRIISFLQAGYPDSCLICHLVNWWCNN